jgi:hypothetical protein
MITNLIPSLQTKHFHLLTLKPSSLFLLFTLPIQFPFLHCPRLLESVSSIPSSVLPDCLSPVLQHLVKLVPGPIWSTGRARGYKDPAEAITVVFSDIVV